MTYLNKSQIDGIVKIALEAGEIAKEFFVKKSFTISKKVDDSDVTSADIAVSDFIYKSLSDLLPEVEIICEEKVKDDVKGSVFFLIDPIDGTSGYANGKDEFSINIAIIKDKKPVFGLIYAPIFAGGKIAFNHHDRGVVIYDNLLQQDFTNDFNITSTPRIITKDDRVSSVNSLKVITSRRSSDNKINSFLLQQYEPHYKENKVTITKLSSAVKFFYLIDDGYDLYIHLNPTMEWDTAAGQALVEALGFGVKKLEVKNNEFSIANDLSYNKNRYINSSFVIE